jgi:hypothetical protein
VVPITTGFFRATAEVEQRLGRVVGAEIDRHVAVCEGGIQVVADIGGGDDLQFEGSSGFE